MERSRSGQVAPYLLRGSSTAHSTCAVSGPRELKVTAVEPPCFAMQHRISGSRRLVRFLPLACLAVAVWSVAAEQATAQPNMTDYLKRMDANGNGVLEPSEMSDRFQGFWGSTLRERGIDVSRPVPIDRLTSIMQERFDRMRRDREEGGGSSRFGRSRRGGDDGDRGRSDRDRRDNDRRRDDRRSNEQDATAMLVPGFGNDFEPLPVPGFESLAETEDDWESQFDRRTLEMVRDIIRRYDRDRSGVLEREEWANGQWRTDPAASDLDNDGRLTAKELAMRLAQSRSTEGDREGDRGRGSWGSRGGDSDRGRGGWGGRGGEGGGWGGRGGEGGGWFGSRESSDSPPETRPSTTSSTRNDKPTATSYRFKTPTERLPKGMPEWFARLDINGDGQISMAEFASEWSVAQAAEFRSWDHNGDGIITPGECLAGQQSGEMVASTSSSAAPSSSSMAQASSGGNGPSSGPPSGGSSRFGSGSSMNGRSGFSGGFGSRGSSSSATPTGFGRSGPSSQGGSPSSTPASATPVSNEGAGTTSSAPSNFSAGASNTYREIYTKKFHEWDANRNGVLDGDEINPSVRSADTNGDGRITLEELLGRFARPR